MSIRKPSMAAGVLVLVVLTAPACVSKKMFRGQTEDTDSRVVAVESAVEANQRRISDMKGETDSKLSALKSDAEKALSLGTEAMGKARSAESLAASASNGKLIWSVALTDDAVKFELGRAVLSSNAISALESLAKKVKGYGKAVYLEIEGHTDSTGSEPLNTMLGDKRASAARNYLNTNGGIPLHAMNVISYGESRPIADNSSRAGRAQNRRVVIRVLE